MKTVHGDVISGFAILCGAHDPAIQMVLNRDFDGWIDTPQEQYVALHMCPACEHEILMVLK